MLWEDLQSFLWKIEKVHDDRWNGRWKKFENRCQHPLRAIERLNEYIEMWLIFIRYPKFVATFRIHGIRFTRIPPAK